jgi:molecular chaperone GrpE (heat shock protein)
MTEQLNPPGFFGRLFNSLLGRAPAPVTITEVREVFRPSADEAELRAQVAGLRLDVEERDQRIEAMQREYTALQAAKEKAAGDGGQEQLERLFKKLAGPLSNIAALADLGKAGRDIAASDLLGLFQSLEKELAHAGLERVGAAGEATSFDTALHQRMSGGSVHAGTQVVVRVPGYRQGEKILLKAMVSTRESN